MKRFLLFFGLVNIFSFVHAQNVGVGTGFPNSSAILHISSSNKGVLFPNVYLDGTVDNSSVPAPATNLIVFNTNPNLSRGRGLYFNSGNNVSANWEKVGDLVLPYSSGTSTNGYAFYIQNYSASTASVGIQGFSQNGYGLYGSSANGTGVYATSTSGNALEVSGKIKIAGTGQSPAAGKVLTSDANGNATWEGLVGFSCRGIKSGGSSEIPGVTYIKVPFWSEVYDLGNNYNNSEVSPHSTFTAPYNGIYHFDTQITWSYNSLSDRYSISLVINQNGSISTLIRGEGRLGDGTDSRAISADVKLNAGTQVWVEVYQNSSDILSLSTDSRSSFFNGRLVIKL